MTLSQKNTHPGGMLVHGGLLVRTDGYPQYSHLRILEFHFVVLGVYLHGVLGLGGKDRSREYSRRRIDVLREELAFDKYRIVGWV